MEALAVLGVSVQVVGTYLIWPSRRNIPAHLGLGFCMSAYIVPGLTTNLWDAFDPAIVGVYAIMNLLGAASLIAGLLLGARSTYVPRLKGIFMALFDGRVDLDGARKRLEILGAIGVIGMIVAYIIMGFVPMFADDPLQAKQFKGPYHEPYYRAAYLFRFSFSTLVAVLPILLLVGWLDRRKRPVLLAILAACLISVSLAREASAKGVITFAGFLLTRYRGAARWYLAFVVIVYPLGSAAYLLLGILMGAERLTAVYSVDSLGDIVGSGMPDIRDQLGLLTGFYDSDGHTWGRTIYGGLIPGNYPWNPSVWTLTYDDIGADITETVSGGLRLTHAMWGYCNFGWIGVLLLPFLSGFGSGCIVAAVKDLPHERSTLSSALCIVILMTLGRQVTEFYFLSIHNIPTIVAILYVSFGTRLRPPAGSSA